MAVLLFYVHLALYGCFHCPRYSTEHLQMWNWMTYRNLLTPSCCPASVINRPVFNRSESVCGRSRASTPALPQAWCLELLQPLAQSQVRGGEIDAGTLAKPRHPLRAQQRLITCHCGLLSTPLPHCFLLQRRGMIHSSCLCLPASLCAWLCCFVPSLLKCNMNMNSIASFPLARHCACCNSLLQVGDNW